MKQNARTVDGILQKQKITGGGQLTNQEQRIIMSTGYLELAKKLGKSASGNIARDSDSTESSMQAPTLRTQLLSQDDNDNDSTIIFTDIFIGNVFSVLLYIIFVHSFQLAIPMIRITR